MFTRALRFFALYVGVSVLAIAAFLFHAFPYHPNSTSAWCVLIAPVLIIGAPATLLIERQLPVPRRPLATSRISRGAQFALVALVSALLLAALGIALWRYLAL
jgi:hypothetical protein